MPQMAKPIFAHRTRAIATTAIPVLIGLVFWYAAIGKSLYFDDFSRTLNSIRWLPGLAVRHLPWLIPLLEIALGFFLIAGIGLRKTLFVTIVVLVAFSVFLGLLLLNPYSPACNCMAWIKFSNDAWTNNLFALLRNLVLLLLVGVGIGVVPRNSSMNAQAVVHTSSGSTSAFTLVELLVVLGILTIIMGILLTALSRARGQARLTHCATIQRELGSLSFARAVESKGFLFLAGEINLEGPVQTTLGELLNDPAHTRYVWQSVRDAGVVESFPVMQPLSFPYCVLPRKVPVTPVVLHGEIPEPYRRWACPSQVVDDEDHAHVTTYINVNRTNSMSALWASGAGYALNGVALGFQTDADKQAYRGQLSKVRAASEVLMLADAKVGIGVAPATWFENPPEGVETRTLDDAIRVASVPTRPTRPDEKRHRNRANVLMFDGHVESVDTKSMGELLLWKK
jgi:prepilin-type processing-associated H-X9-DG protein